MDGLMKLSDLMENGRYIIKARDGMMDLRCKQHSDHFTSDIFDVQEILEWIEQHEDIRHQPQDLHVTVPLTQIMTAYAQQAGKSPEEMFQEMYSEVYPKDKGRWHCFSCKKDVKPDFKSRYLPKCPDCDDEPMWMEED